MDGLWYEERTCQDNFSETKHSNTSGLLCFFSSLSFVVSWLHDTTFLLIRPLWRHDLSASPSDAALSLRSQPPPLCCLIAVKKRLCDYSTTDWNAPSVKTSACADALALNKYHQLQMPLPTPLLRGFNNFVCGRGARRGEKLHPQFHLPPLAVREIAQTTLICLIAKTHISFLFHCHIINKWSTNTDISRLLKWLQFIVLLEMIFMFAAAVRRKAKDITSPQRQ